MPPKGKGSKSKGKSQGVVIDGVNTSEMTREQLEVFALRLKEELEREREERNFYQLERDKLRTFWEITRQQLEDAKANILIKDREIEVVGERNDDDTKNFRQKIKHLHYEHENKCRMFQAQSLMAIQQCETDHREQQFVLLRDKGEFKRLLQSAERDHIDQKKCMKMEFAEAHYRERHKFETYSREMERKFDDHFDDLREEIGKVHQMEQQEFEERKNRQINNLIKDNDLHVYKIQDLFDCISMNNYLVLSKLQLRGEDLAYENHSLRMKMSEIGAENKTLLQPLKHCREEKKKLRTQVKKFQKEKRKYQNLKNRLTTVEQECDNMKWAKIVQELQYAKIKKERDRMYKTFFEGNLVMAQKSMLQEMLYENKMAALTQQIESREAAIEELTNDQPQPQGFVKKYEGIVNKKNATIRELEFQLAILLKSHGGIIQEYKLDLERHNLPVNLSKFDIFKLRRPEPLKIACAIAPGPITTKDLPTVFDRSIGATLSRPLIPLKPVSEYTWSNIEREIPRDMETIYEKQYNRKIVCQPETKEVFTYDPDISNRN